MNANANAVRFVKTRDSATAILRKLGIKPRDYDLFIEKTSDGRLAVQAAKAEVHLQSLTKVQVKPLAKAAAAIKVETTMGTEPKADATSGNCSEVARQLIRAGKTNAEVWAVLKERFNLDDKKRGYPAWYRFQLRRAGELV